MVIVAGKIYVPVERRDAFVTASTDAVIAARSAQGCVDFAVSPDPVEPGRVNVYERWESEADLLAFRGDGPGEDLSADIIEADVTRFQISSSGPA